MRNCIADALKGYGARPYIEVRVEESHTTQLVYRGEKLEVVDKSRSLGGSVRALVDGSWGFVSFSNLEGLKRNVSLAVEEARMVGGESFEMILSNPVVDKSIAKRGDASIMPLEAKKKILDEYNDIVLSSPRIQSSNIVYRDASSKVVFANSIGSYIEQDKPDLALRIVAIARENGEIQQSGLSMGSRGEISAVEGLQDEVKEVARRAGALLDAPEVVGGEYDVILDPVLAGVFVHEAFGHLSESDFVYQNEQLRKIMVLGRRFGGEALNIVDDATISNLRGSYKYDDEGTPSSKNYLIRNGILTGRLHSRETASRMGEHPTGNARTLNYLFSPIVRMSNTFFENGDMSFDNMVADVKEGIYVKDWYGGTTSLEMFTFSGAEAYAIRDGQVEELLRGPVLTGNVFVTLGNIDAVGNDLDMNQGGGCGKWGQSPLPVSNGSPHIRIRRCVVGGK
jgi:TldD protein